ncbi:MAG: ABC transporter ATP-binding protein [Betaproteobacteria bacterium]|nr:ABC transporter ATP-binding protein [Betaproteobacteria bacterium]
MAKPVLEVLGLTKRFGGLVATDAVTFDVVPGEIHALIGPNGAGKTTLVHQLSGAVAADAGSIRFNGADITVMPTHDRVRAGLARSYQITSIFRRLTVVDNIVLAVQARNGTSLSFWRPIKSESALYDEARAIAKDVGLAGREEIVSGFLAHGEQRQLEVGLALATKPLCVMLDEPMAGMGPEESERMIPLISGLRATRSVLLIEHDMDAVFRLADRISVLVSGRIISTGTPAAIRASDEVRRAYLGDETVHG